MGPDFWIASYDGLLRLDMPKGAFLVGYADDVAVVVEARNADLAQLILCQVMIRVTRWMTEHGLSLALAKTEVVLLTRKEIPTILPMYVESELVTTRPTAKYLGVTLDSKLCFWPHIREVTAKAEARIAALSRLMRNVGGPWTSKRRRSKRRGSKILMATTGYGNGGNSHSDAKRCRIWRILLQFRLAVARISNFSPFVKSCSGLSRSCYHICCCQPKLQKILHLLASLNAQEKESLNLRGRDSAKEDQEM